jgi:2-methylcitrate dehydratase PrpD
VTHPDGATSILGAYCVQMATAELPAPVLRKAASCVLDALGLGLPAHDQHTFAALDALTPCASPNAPSALIWASRRRANLADAVQANALSVHAQFHDDTDYSSWTHPGSLIVPIAVSLAESKQASLLQTLRAVACGYNAIAWLGGADHVARRIIERGFRTSAVLGVVGAAATASVLLDLDSNQARNAVAIAASLAGGQLAPLRSGSDEWRIHNARAASTGLLAAGLAQQGVQGAPTALEGPLGLLHSIAGLSEPPAIWSAPPAMDGILGVVAKPYATLGDNMSAVVAAKLLHAERIPQERIARIDIHIWRHFTEYPGTSYRGPFERVTQAVASMAFSVSAMLVYGELEYDKPLAHRHDESILRLVPLVHITPDDAGTPFDARVTVTLDDGTRLVRDASQAGDHMLRHSAVESGALLEDRMQRSSHAHGIGQRMARVLFENQATLEGMRTADWLSVIQARKPA